MQGRRSSRRAGEKSERGDSNGEVGAHEKLLLFASADTVSICHDVIGYDLRHPEGLTEGSIVQTMEDGWFLTYVGNRLRRVRDCYIAHASEDYNSINGMRDIDGETKWSGILRHVKTCPIRERTLRNDNLHDEKTCNLCRYVKPPDLIATMRNYGFRVSECTA